MAKISLNTNRGERIRKWIRSHTEGLQITSVDELSTQLPFDAHLAGFTLFDVKLRDWSGRVDPLFLFDERGQLLYEWPEGYIPSLGELGDICFGILKAKDNSP